MRRVTTPPGPAPGAEVAAVTADEPSRPDRGAGLPRVIRRHALEVATLVVVALFHLAAALPAHGPVWTDDEVGPLATARLFAGVGQPLDLAHQSYYPAWAIVLAPVWWVTSDPATVYRVAVGMSALLGVLLVLPLASLARRTGLGPGYATVVAGVVAIAPSRVVFSSYALIENALVLALAINVVAAIRYAERPSAPRAVVLAAASAATFMTHGRLVPVVGATVLWFVVDFLSGRRRAGAWGAASTAVAAGLAYAIHVYAAATLYGNGTARETRSLGRLVEAEPLAAAGVLVGQAWYASAAWMGCAIVGALVVADLARAEWRRRRPSVAWWAAVTFGGMLAISVLLITAAYLRSGGRADLLTYGRYIEPALVVLALLGLAQMARGAVPRRRLLVVLGGTVVASAVVVTWSSLTVRPGAWFAPINIPGVLASRSWLGTDLPPWWFASLAVTLVLVVVVVTTGRRGAGRVAVVVVAAAFVVSSVLVLQQVHRFNAALGGQPGIVSLLRDLPDGSVAFDANGADWVGQNQLQYWLNDEVVEVFDSSVDPVPAVDYVVARPYSFRARTQGATLIGQGSSSDAVWVFDEGLASRMERRGYAAPDNPVEPLRGFKADVVSPQAKEQIPTDRTTRVDLTVTNTGTSSWTPLVARGSDPTGAVRLVLWWPVEDGRAPQIVDLPYTVVPDADVSFDVALDPPPGTTEGDVAVTLVQEGVGELGDEPLLLLPLDGG